MAGRSKSKTRSKTKIKKVTKLPKRAKPGDLVEMDIGKRGGGERPQVFEAQDQVMWKMVKKPKK